MLTVAHRTFILTAFDYELRSCVNTNCRGKKVLLRTSTSCSLYYSVLNLSSLSRILGDNYPDFIWRNHRRAKDGDGK